MKIFKNAPYKDFPRKEHVYHCSIKEQNLLCAIMERAILDLKCRNKERIFFKSSKRWFLSKDFSPFSFIWVCYQLGLSDDIVNALRKIAKESFI